MWNPASFLVIQLSKSLDRWIFLPAKEGFDCPKLKQFLQCLLPNDQYLSIKGLATLLQFQWKSKSINMPTWRLASGNLDKSSASITGLPRSATRAISISYLPFEVVKRSVLKIVGQLPSVIVTNYYVMGWKCFLVHYQIQPIHILAP